jgi:hypothetical protein
MNTLEKELQIVLNRYSAENASNTPDFILAKYLLDCLTAWNSATQHRETWYGRDTKPMEGMMTNLSLVAPKEELK